MSGKISFRDDLTSLFPLSHSLRSLYSYISLSLKSFDSRFGRVFLSLSLFLQALENSIAAWWESRGYIWGTYRDISSGTQKPKEAIKMFPENGNKRPLPLAFPLSGSFRKGPFLFLFSGTLELSRYVLTVLLFLGKNIGSKIQPSILLSSRWSSSEINPFLEMWNESGSEFRMKKKCEDRKLWALPLSCLLARIKRTRWQNWHFFFS